ncbi:hypothetical protein N9917_05090 [Deltaproteobacteria bacterium]|nr:hypothetical protein [Deltaproteobacteria bacterium]
MSRTDEIEAEMASLREQMATLGKEWRGLKSRALSRKMNKTLFPDGEITLEGVMDVDWNELGNGGYGQKWWNKITNWLSLQQSGVYDKATGKDTGDMPLRGVYRDGYNPDTNQVAFKVMMRQPEPLESQMGLLLILPLVKPHEGWKRFSIFRHDCGEGGNFWSVRVSEDGKTAEVWYDRHLRYEDSYDHYKAEFTGTVEEALEHIRQKHPYELEESECEECGRYCDC